MEVKRERERERGRIEKDREKERKKERKRERGGGMGCGGRENRKTDRARNNDVLQQKAVFCHLIFCTLYS